LIVMPVMFVDRQQRGGEHPGHHEEDDGGHHEVGAEPDTGPRHTRGGDTTDGGAQAPEAVQPVHHRPVPPRAQPRPLHVHRDVDVDVEHRHPRQTDQHERPHGRDADQCQERRDRRRAADDREPGPEATDQPRHGRAPDQAGRARHRQQHPERIGADRDLVADLGQPRDERREQRAVHGELQSDGRERPIAADRPVVDLVRRGVRRRARVRGVARGHPTSI
jgi:hypothetical protein